MSDSGNRLLATYDASSHFDEVVGPQRRARRGAGLLLRYLRRLGTAELIKRQSAAELSVRSMGISFTVYSDGEDIDRDWPLDVIPRIVTSLEWEKVSRGLEQRLRALNMFIDDVYNEQRIFKDGVIPRELLADSKNFRPQCVGFKPLKNVWAHICGSDLVRDGDGRFYVLEDNLRVPSGVSYMLENRHVMKRILPDLFESYSIQPVDAYPSQLFDTLASMSPRPADYPEVVVLTPGIYNSAYFEHAFLAQRMGAELVSGDDLFVDDDDCVYMKTVAGPERVDVIYRRVDDMFLDPDTFDPDSMLGVKGLMRAWLKGNVGLVNAPGAGVADDKVVYAYVPQMIRYYLSEDAVVPNVETYLCTDPKMRDHVLKNLDNLVVKPANESGGYGLFMGPQATKKEKRAVTAAIKHDPRNWIAQPLVSLSTVPTITENQIAPRHVDLRPFILQGDKTYVTAGGLTRVARREGSYVVNSSQGGGSKDTWVVSG
ncbi:MAG: circularly permuted type 2 ATP-grasp protein [Pseudomonadota bacterium]